MTPTSSSRAQWNGQEEQLNGRGSVGSDGSLQRTPPEPTASVMRRSVPTSPSFEQAPPPPPHHSPPRLSLREPDAGPVRPSSANGAGYRLDSPRMVTTTSEQPSESLAFRPRTRADGSTPPTHSRSSSAGYPTIEEEGLEGNGTEQEVESLQYHAFDDAPKKNKTQNRASHMPTQSVGSSSSGGEHRGPQLTVPGAVQRPTSMYSLGSDPRGRSLSPYSGHGSPQDSPKGYPRDVSRSGRSPSGRPTSYVNLLNDVPYHQQIAPNSLISHKSLQGAVGSAASLLDTKKTLDMYRANIKKTTDMAAQYEFAIYMVNCSQDPSISAEIDPAELINEAKHILQRLADKVYPFAQYYLGDGYFSGLFNKSKPDQDKAFPLFIAASKHGHAEAGFRAALCYEFGWGTAKSYAKAVQFYRTAASKNHPGAASRLGMACLQNQMGLFGRDKYREGLKWLKRAQEGADRQYNAAPYELGLLHLTGFGDDVFKDEVYAAQLFTQSAELGHMQANYLMGQAYENGIYGCPKDAALSVHFYNGAATQGHAEAMLALTAWYMVGAEPVLEKDEREAYEWALKAAETGFGKAEYAVGYFTEMGIGCRRDPLGANYWYVQAADKGNENAKQRLKIIHEAASGVDTSGMAASKDEGKGKKKFMGIF
ncbi:Chitin synthase 4 [Saxophila tyrrhenica]|uniref:Chitin synthase 4 n=1 Tax=Saxophila tyrrhenica TaxID=1690608 RepID=A0AAV9PHJ2_9PEZI|nr:Chitin synthase 4 [Saxophila tyrrhenica]